MTKVFNLNILGMNCVNCSQAIEKVIKKIDGVVDAEVSFASNTGKFTLKNEDVLNIVVDKIRKIGYEVIDDYEELENKKRKNLNIILRNFIISVFLLAIIMFIEMIGSLPYFVKAVACIVISGIVLFYCGKSFFIRGYKSLIEKNYDMNVLISLGSLAAYLYSLFIAIFAPSMQEHFYSSSASMIISFVLLGKYLEEKSKLKANDYIKSLLELIPKKAHLIISNGEIEDVLANTLQVKDIVLVKNGEYIPCDGKIIDGSGEINTSSLTGESMPFFKKIGDEVNAGSISINAILHIEVTKPQNKTLIAEVVSLINKANNKKLPISKFADKVANIFVPIVCLISILTFVAWFLFGDIYFGIICAISVLIISCPCALGLATPIAIVCSISNAAKNGILVSNPETLEILKDINVAVFDKTGTLTKGKISVHSTNLSNKDLEIISSIEMLSEHPISNAILNYSKDLKLTQTKFNGNVETIIGKGIKATTEDRTILIGNIGFLEENGVKVIIDDDIEKRLKSGFGMIFIAKNNYFEGYVSFTDEIKDNSKEVISYLKRNNVKTIMLTGDNKKTANYVASLVGIEEVYAEVLPDGKYKLIEKLKNDGKLLFVGDGINDAPSLKLADIGIAMNSGSDIAKDSGDIVFIENKIENVAFCIELSKKTMNAIKQNLFWAFFYNIICIPIAAGVLFPFFGIILVPMYASIAMCFSSVTVVLNSIRLKIAKIRTF